MKYFFFQILFCRTPCIFIDKVESEFLQLEEYKPWVRLRHIDYIFFIRTESGEKLETFLKQLNVLHPVFRFLHAKKVSVNFLDVKVRVNGNEFETDLYRKPADCHQFLVFNSD